MSDDAFNAPLSTPDLRERARMSSTFGIISVVLCLITPCASCLSLIAALPMGLVAVQYGRTVLASGPDEVAEVQARHGMVTGIISLVYSGLVLALVSAYILLYVAMIGLAIASGI